MIRRYAPPTILAMALLAALPAAAPFECSPEASRVVLPGIWRETRGAGEIVISCSLEQTPFQDTVGKEVRRNCQGIWTVVEGAQGYKPGDWLFYVADPSPTNQWDGCKEFKGGEYPPPRGPGFGSMPKAKIRITFESPAKHAGDQAPHIVYEVEGKPNEKARFRFIKPLPQGPLLLPPR
jgi:hypothetical protein